MSAAVDHISEAQCDQAVTRLLNDAQAGDSSAASALLPLVYQQLRRLAKQKMRQERPDQTLQATALVHEAYIRLVDQTQVQHWDSRGHIFVAAAEQEAMRAVSAALASPADEWTRKTLDIACHVLRQKGDLAGAEELLRCATFIDWNAEGRLFELSKVWIDLGEILLLQDKGPRRQRLLRRR